MCTQCIQALSNQRATISLHLSIFDGGWSRLQQPEVKAEFECLLLCWYPNKFKPPKSSQSTPVKEFFTSSLSYSFIVSFNNRIHRQTKLKLPGSYTSNRWVLASALHTRVTRGLNSLLREVPPKILTYQSIHKRWVTCYSLVLRDYVLWNNLSYFISS